MICFMYCTLFYFITGYQASASKFAVFVAVCILVQLISETIGGICAILTRTATMGIMLSSTLLTVRHRCSEPLPTAAFPPLASENLEGAVK